MVVRLRLLYRSLKGATKYMKKLWFLVCACLILTAMLAACGDNGEQEAHTHTYADSWSYDEDGHWYAATCEHTEEKANVGAHVDEQNDGICDVCAYGSDHVHEFAPEWSSDAQSHWHASSCGHDVKDALGAHVDENNDDACDVCDHKGDCEHPVAADAWLSDAQMHWHGASCGHNIRLDAQEHADADNDGVCDVCAWSDPDHTHTYKTEYAFDAQKHWFDADCGHTVKGDEQAHVDQNNDGACDVCPYNDGCAHEYSTLWSVDGTHHWHDVTCTHTIAPADKAEHTDLDNNGICDVCEYQDHEHTYDTEKWMYDDNGHWHAASCGCTLRSDESAHTDANNDGACDVCDWNDGCEHPLDTVWSSDGTHHWHAVTCTHTVEPTDKVTHKDPENDGVCNVCGYYDRAHTHTYSDTLTVDADTHYYASTCGHTGARKDETAHVDENYDDKCDVCGGVASLQIVIDKVTSDASAALVNGGSIINTNTYYFGAEPYVSTENVTYLFGNGYLYTNDGIYERWYTLMDDMTVFAARRVDGMFEAESASADDMAGYYFNGQFLYGAMEARGVEALLYDLYAFALSNGGVRTSYHAATGTYGFDFYYYNGYGSLYFVTTRFVHSAQGAITDMRITSTVYSSYEQGEDGSFYVADGAAIESKYDMVITQTVGERTAVNEYGPEKFRFESFDFMDDDEFPVGDVIYLDPGKSTKLYFTNVVPETASAKIDLMNVEINADSSQVIYYMAYSGDHIYIKGVAAGTYTMTVTTANVTKTVTIVVGTPALQSIAPQIYYKDYSGLYTTTVGTTYTLYAGQTLYFNALANPTAANADYTVSASGGTLGSGTVTYGSSKVAVSTFTAPAGTYTITLTSTEDEDITTTLTVNVQPEPSVGDILSGTYMADIFDYNVSQTSSSRVMVTFAPKSAGAAEGQVTLTRGEMSEVLSYRYENGEIVLSHVSGDLLGYTLTLNDQYSVTINWKYNDREMPQVMLPYTYQNRVFTETWVSADDKLDNDVPMYTFVFGDQGYVHDAQNDEYPDMLSQVNNATGEITVTFLDDVSGTALDEIQSMTFDPDANTITLVLAQQTIILTPYAGW